MRDRKRPLLEHLSELRKRFLISLGFVLLGAIAAYAFVDRIIAIIIRPIKTQLIFTAPTEAFLVTLKVAVACGVIIVSPIIVYQAWKFASIALKKKERRVINSYAPISLALFLAGVGFAYFLVAPIGLRFLLSFGGEAFQPLITISKYISYLAVLALGFGLVFELPVVMHFLSRLGVVTPEKLSRNRVYFIVGIFAIGALLTPPDVFTQVLLAIPLVLLYEISILTIRLAQ